MTQIDSDVMDIFKGAEKIEVLGKLPTFLWAYIDAVQKLTRDAEHDPDAYAESLPSISKILLILDSAAEHLSNEELRAEIAKHSDLALKLSDHSLTAKEFSDHLAANMPALERLAGSRREAGDSAMGHFQLDQELLRAEKVKTGRSADVIVTVDLINDVSAYLSKEVLTEGISTVLVIDNAGTLIVNVGSKPALDVVGLAAVAAANFAATEQIARLIGERDFVLLFYKGHSESFHFCRVGTEYIIVTIFGNAMSLGLLRLKIAEVARVLESKLPKREA